MVGAAAVVLLGEELVMRYQGNECKSSWIRYPAQLRLSLPLLSVQGKL